MEVVKYHNDINILKIGNFSERELNLFFTFILKAQDFKDGKVQLSFAETKKIIEGSRSDEKLITDVRKLNIKLKSIVQEIRDENGDYRPFSLFKELAVSPSRKVVEAELDERFKRLVTDLIKNFTIFDLKDFVKLESKHSKTLFRFLKQWESTKKYTVSMDEFRQIFNIPESYRQTHIDQKVLKPALEQLKQFFPNLKLQKVKKGVKIDSLVFTWKEKAKLIEEKPKDTGFVERKQGLTAEDYYEIENGKEIEKVEEAITLEEREPTEEEIEMVKFLNRKLNLGYSEKFLTPQIARAVLKEKGLW